MADTALIDKNFSKRLDRAYDYFDSDRLEDCLLQAREILDDSACPRYHRMKTLVILEYVLGDWYEVKKCHTDAEALWKATRCWHSESEDKTTEKHMKEIHGELDDMEHTLEKDEPQLSDEDENAESIEIQNEHDERDERTKRMRAMMNVTLSRRKILT